MSRRWSRAVGRVADDGAHMDAGELLAFAFPDRIARNRGDGTFRIGDATIDAARFLVHVPGEPEQALTVRELGLLKTFAANPGKVLTRDALLDAVWGKDYFAASRTLDQHILQIRRKLGAYGVRIETIRGAGYRLAE